MAAPSTGDDLPSFIKRKHGRIRRVLFILLVPILGGQLALFIEKVPDYVAKLQKLYADGKKDVVVVDTHRVVWYQNPTWKRRTIVEGKTERDNVSAAKKDVERAVLVISPPGLRKHDGRN